MSILSDASVAPNGVHSFPPDNGAPSSAADSPADSPTTPQSAVNGIKVDIDFPDESDVRHDPMDVSLDKLDALSTRAELNTPLNPDSISVDTPRDTPLITTQSQPDVEMSELPAGPTSPVKDEASPAINGHSAHVNDSSTTPAAPNGISNTPLMSSEHANNETSNNEWNSDEPPAKRARRFSDAEQASVAHSPPQSVIDTATPGAETVHAPTPPQPPAEQKVSTITQAQHRFCMSTIRTLKKLKDAGPFLLPVDPIALNIPHYFTVVRHPMDFSTVERKLIASNPQKPDPNLSELRYHNTDEFIADVRLIFTNCVAFNGPDHFVTQMGKRVESVFDKQIKTLPPPAEEPKPPVKKATPPPPPPVAAPPPKKAAARRPSTSVPTIRRSETETARPKREIHPPPPKDLPYNDLPKKPRRAARAKRNDGTTEQLKFCTKIVNELYKKQYFNIASPFYYPVDYVTLDLPQYPKIVKHPMDLSTIKKRLDDKEYPDANKFRDDFNLMIQNCLKFNSPGEPVRACALEVQRVFEEKWAALPPLHEPSEDEEEEEEDESDDDRSRSIAMMESQIESLKGTVAALKNKRMKKEQKKEKKREKYPPPAAASTASSSKTNGKASNKSPSGGGGGKKNKKKVVADDDILSFDQKKELSEIIGNLDGAKLEKVISIIHEGVPEIRDSTEEIELDIDSLPASVLIKLFNLVVRPLKAPAPKRNRTGTGTGTGGLKRKSMDEDVEAEKIRLLEERMRLFDNKAAPVVPLARQDHDMASSDESSSDSGSESE